MTLVHLKKMMNIKYFMVGYLGLLVFFSALYFKDLAMFVYGLAIVALYVLYDVVWTYVRDRVWYLPISSVISAFVLTIAALPKPPLIILVVLPFLAVASKQLLHLKKNRHIFNPASFALAIVALATPAVSWWAAAGARLPVSVLDLRHPDLGLLIFLFITAAAIIILWRQNRWHVTLPFFISYSFFLCGISLVNGVALNSLPQVLIQQVLSGVTIFFATVMVIEPLTSTFSTRRQEVYYGAFVGFAAIAVTYLIRVFSIVNIDPFVYGLLSGNLFACLLFLPNRKQDQACACRQTTPTIAHEPSYWFRAVPEKRRFSSLQGDKHVDVIIIGGGIAGISAAYFLSKAGIKTALLEAATIGSGDSGYTTACATRFLDTLDTTLGAWESNDAAIRLLRNTIKEEKIACDWQDVDATCFTRERDKKSLEQFAATAQTLQAKDGTIEYLGKKDAMAAIGIDVEAAYRKKASEGVFHMRKLLVGLSETAIKNGADFFEESAVIDIALGHTITVKTKEGSVTAPWLVVAVGAPPAKFFPAVNSVLRSSISYVIDVQFSQKQPLSAGFFWDDQEPYHYYRSVGANEVLLGGEDWKTGEPKSALSPHMQLEGWLKDVVGRAAPFKPVNGWQGSLFTTPDTLPLIGPHAAYGNNTIFLTGWAGNGTAQGFFGGHIAADLVGQKKNTYQHLFDCNRPLAWPEAKKQPMPEAQPLQNLLENKGMIVDVAGQKLAVVKKDGSLKAFSAVCPHLGCDVGWNDEKKTWDCPCHGSRFASDGSLKRGPAKRGLDPVDIKTDENKIELV